MSFSALSRAHADSYNNGKDCEAITPQSASSLSSSGGPGLHGHSPGPPAPTSVYAVVCALGFHYALTACGRKHPGGGSWAYALLFLMGLLVVALGFLSVIHVFLVLTGQTTRQVVQRLRASGGTGAGGGRGSVVARIGGALRRTLPTAGAQQPGAAAVSAGQGPEGRLMALNAGQLAQNCVYLLCGVRPAWLAGHSPWVAAANEWASVACSNSYYSCC
ncbi:hypothetical protein GPECTOR_243g592 [Gonium pectorale]|uniref:Uncharacterized protein n=1 Tax=Gonium pectorale TaxID=33097 RepID=A0A150FWC8_GONPE|nr:hypothetical protein GPECTOR_243g592 [Gonium pectorale]|eukprot:KXZ41922.1 hypothetical protein GPECTOR_243g592 [Gonium pectorale]